MMDMDRKAREYEVTTTVEVTAVVTVVAYDHDDAVDRGGRIALESITWDEDANRADVGWMRVTDVQAAEGEPTDLPVTEVAA